MNSLNDLLADLARPDIWEEILGLVLALALAYGLSLWVRRRLADPDRLVSSTESVWLGRHVLDGVMFAVVALCLTFLAGRIVGQHQTLSLLKVANPILMALAAIRLVSRTFAVSFPSSVLARVTEQLLSWLAWMAVVLWVTGLLPTVLAELADIELPLGASKINLQSVLVGAISAGGVIVVTLWFSAMLERRVLRGAVDDLSVRKILANGIRAALLLVGVLFALNAVGIDLKALSVMGGALGIGVGLGLQGLAANYVSGYVLLFERSIRIGDYVRVDDFQGIVKDINTRYTLIQGSNGVEAIVPNLRLTTSRVENLEQSSPKESFNAQVCLAYGCDIETVQALLLETVSKNERILGSPAPAVLIQALGPHGIDVQVSYWIADPRNAQGQVRSDLNVAMLKALHQAGIELATRPYLAPQFSAGPAQTLPPAGPQRSSADR